MAADEQTETERIERALEGVNAGYIAEMQERWIADPASVDPEWRALFEPAIAEPAIARPPDLPAAEATPAEAPPAEVAPALPEGAAPLRGPAARLARNMTASLGVPTATSFRDVDVAILEARRRELLAQLAPRRVSFTHLIGFAIARAASEQPGMTAYYLEADGTAHRVDPGGVHLGLAVDVERPDGGRFLVVPVIRAAEATDFATFHARYEELVEKARANRLSPDDMAGATITLTNPGTLGTTASVARLMPGQGAIIATGAIRNVGQARVMTISSTYDHRVIQGAESGAFLGRIDALLQGADGFYESLGLHPSAPAGAGEPPLAPGAAATDDDLRAVAAGMALVRAYRSFGHLAARLDPLGSEPVGDPALDPEPLGLTPEAMARVPASLLRIDVPGATLAEALPALRATYCGSIAYEVEHIASHDERVWLRQAIESGAHRTPMSADEQKALLERLTIVEGLERFLHKAYLGQKRFSIEGLDTMVPVLDALLGGAANAGAEDVVIGMAHRGRLNVLAHIVGVSYEAILVEFEAGRGGGDALVPKGGLDDVKYHLGANGTFTTADGKALRITLSPNPSHLEAVNPVVEGHARAQQSDRTVPVATVNPDRTVPILIHGDAAFAAQGVVAETFNMARLAGYRTGGTLHLIANNQVGFTTEPSEARSTVYSSDLAKGFDAPIIHVNSDDAEACLAAARLAWMYREKFHGDVVIDLVGYRRYGHNEGDEPAYTQPQMYAAIAAHPSVREQYQSTLVEAKVVSSEEADGWAKAFAKDLAARQTAVRRRHAEPQLDRGEEAIGAEESAEPMTAVDAETLRALNAALLSVPDGFTINPKLAKQLDRRLAALDDPEPRIEWAQAEALAFGSLLLEGSPIRLTGQDTVRGTFSQRHLALHDAATGAVHVPIQGLPAARASFELYNSPLSEYACLGFEYGYAATAPEALVLWEAQYGDFVNGAEIIVDQFIIAGLAKWRQTSRLTLLLPHGYEGSGPEHSSARLERFLALGAEGNIRVVYPTTPAQYFHVLRRQARHGDMRPMVVMTPKSLLRLPEAASRLADLTDGAFASVLDDSTVAAPNAIRRVILCSGKVYYDLAASELRAEQGDLAIVRCERLYPFPSSDLESVLARYPGVERVAWVQEEPRNMGARKFVLPKIRHLVPFRIPLGDISRPERSRPAEGYPAAHHVEQARIVREALTS
jgi:2-oxoglutarate dehydrogenase E1 component